MSGVRFREFNTRHKTGRGIAVRFGFAYPSTYRAGITSLATHLFYSILNDREDTSCERYFRFGVQSPCHSLESGRQLRDNHIVGFSLSYEEDIVNVVQMLEMGQVPIESSERTETDPIVIMGGPAVTANPEPYADFVDAFVIGEADVVIHEIVDTVGEAMSRKEALAGLKQIRGVYVPLLGRPPVDRLVIDNLDSLPHPTAQILPEVEEDDEHAPVFGKSLLVEVTRGCGHSCRFCLVGHICRPRRVRSLDRLEEIIRKGVSETPVSKVALIGSSLGDMDRLDELTEWIVSQGLGVSVPSLRADSVSSELLSALVRGGQRTLTIAPETGSETLRRTIGKGLSDSDIEGAVQAAMSAGLKSVKLYFIVGLPGETDQDAVDIARLVDQLSSRYPLRFTLSISPFVPKANTRFEREPQPSIEVIRSRLRTVERHLKGISRVTVEPIDPRNARIEAALSIGGRDLGRVVRLAARYGGLGGWRRAEREAGVQFLELAGQDRRGVEELPWSFIRL
ncbi:MAG: radical SAM protein [Candidatus Thorarchaeota archaeon]|nr:radical SAM protein [Candidatus Thorarchaeota archaeon]